MPGPPVNPFAPYGPPPFATQVLSDYSGTDLVYTGYAMSNSGESTVTVSAASNANPVSFTATAHGFNFVGAAATMLPVVRITGATGNWTPINGVWVATPTSANAFTIAVDSSGFGALTGTLVVTTLAPRTSQPVWSISKNVYTAGGVLVWTGWAALPAGVNCRDLVSGSIAMAFIWNNRATYSYC